MAIVASSIGTSVTAEVKKPLFSLLQRRITHTPEGHEISHYLPFSDIQLAGVGSDSGNVMATFKAPATITVRPDRSEGMVGSPSSLVKSDNPYAGANLASQIWPLNNSETARSSGRLSLRGTASNGGTEEKFDTFDTEEQAVQWISEDSLLERVGIVRTPKGVKIMYHDMFMYKMADRLKQVHQFLGRWTPQMAFMGLGHMEGSNVVRPGMTWSVGNAFWREKKYEGAGYTYFPTDYVPYTTMKRVGPYWSIYHSLFYAWFNSLSDARAKGGSACLARMDNSAKGGQQTDTICAMAQLLHASYYGVTESPSAPETPPTHQEVIDGMKTHLLDDVTSGYYHLDPCGLSKTNLMNYVAWSFIKAIAFSYTNKMQTPVYPGQT